jgi:hypothetical protein
MNPEDIKIKESQVITLIMSLSYVDPGESVVSESPYEVAP